MPAAEKRPSLVERSQPGVTVGVHGLIDFGAMTISENHQLGFSENLVDEASLKFTEDMIALPDEQTQWRRLDALTV
ncbi:hypothetical protein M2281_003868 [Mesorhizobium soli]|uniref:hypothetical protein n=1 Tax=Pseudaminobacter soli (ex Li et al. 2025) TaxID=1295366 RepID=UPI0024733FDB|nr:hypothetical protein [Mesorhizobium soli]MDH6233257.1 hypothetical protein [Mesorhizobium soli]